MYVRTNPQHFHHHNNITTPTRVVFKKTRIIIYGKTRIVVGSSKWNVQVIQNKNIIMKESKHAKRRRASSERKIPKAQKKKNKKAQERLAFAWEGEARDSTCSTHSRPPFHIRWQSPRFSLPCILY